MDLKPRQSKAASIYFLTLCFLFYFFIAFHTPLTGDDWTWGTETGIERLKSFFSNYNGRYASNLIEIILTRYEIMRFLFIAAFSSLLIFTIGRLTDHKTGHVSWLLAFILLLLLPASIFSQTFGWTAGFVNYVPSVALLLAYLVIVRNIYDDECPSYSKGMLWLIVPLGLITQLIVEHVTLFALFTAIYVIVYAYFRHKRFFAIHFAYLVSVLAGSIIMFSNGAYWNVLSGDDTYRTIRNEADESTSTLRRVYNVYSDDMYNFLFLDNMPANLFLGLMALILIIRFDSGSKWVKSVLKPCLLFSVTGFLLYGLFLKDMLGKKFLLEWTNDFEALASIVYFASIALTAIFFLKDGTTKIQTVYYLTGVVLLSAPFAFITPYGPRAALASSVFLILAALKLFSYNFSLSQWPLDKVYKTLIPVALIISLCYLYIFSSIGNADEKRIAYLQKKAADDEEVIHLPDLPFEQFMWMSSPPNEHFNTMFKEFYRIPEETEVNFLPYEKWKEKTSGE